MQTDELLNPRDAARALGISYPTLKQWIYKKKLHSVQTAGGHHRIPSSEIERFLPRTQEKDVFAERRGYRRISGRNQLVGRIIEVRYSGLLAQVKLSIGGQRISSIITADAAREMRLEKGQTAAALIKSTEVMIVARLIAVEAMRYISKTVLATIAAFGVLVGAPTMRATALDSVPQAAPKPCGTITVAAASDLSDAMYEIAANFEKATGCNVRVSTGSSGNFLTQIENGAPFDVFFSADIEYPRKLETDGFADAGSTYLYAVGKIVLWVRNDSRVDLSRGLAGLRDPAIQKLAIANPQHAPYGRAAEQALRKAGVYDAVKDRLVLGENISQAAQFAESGSADAGIIALSLTLSPGLKNKGRFWRVPENLYTPIEQGVVIIRSTKNPQGAQALLDYIKTPAAAALLERYGFALPSKGKS